MLAIVALATIACSSQQPPSVSSDVVTINGSTLVLVDRVAQTMHWTPRDLPPAGLQAPNTVVVTVIADDSLSIVLPANSQYGIWVWGGGSPLDLRIEARIGSQLDQVVQYQSVPVGAHAQAALALSHGRVVGMRYQRLPSSALDQSVNADFNVTGSAARDTVVPSIAAATISDSSSWSISLTSKVGPSGLHEIFYSLDGTTFGMYRSPLRQAGESPTSVYAFAQNNQGVRSPIGKFICSPTGCQEAA